VADRIEALTDHEEVDDRIGRYIDIFASLGYEFLSVGDTIEAICAAGRAVAEVLFPASLDSSRVCCLT
jgi:hypothetical protein